MRATPLALLFTAACSDYTYSELNFTERFLQPDDQLAADVLFVIDNSASMAEEQEQLAANFSGFLEVMRDSSADYRLGIITTDPTEGGALRGGWFDPDTAALEEGFAAAVAVGTHGDRDEQGLQMALLALGTEVNPEFVRTEARLNLVFFSDEDDHSPDDVPLYMQAYRRLAGAGGLAAHAISGDLPDGCASGTSAASAGTRYIQAAESTGGYLESICADDYTDILVRIGLEVTGLADTFVLQRIPDPDTLVVWVDGVVMPTRETDGWTYSPADNAILFHGRSVPRPGMEVFVEYTILTSSVNAAGG